jgi:hypothetical protein
VICRRQIGDVPRGSVVLDGWCQMRMAVPFYGSFIGDTDGRGRDVLPLSCDQPILPGHSAQITTRPQRAAFRPRRLMVSQPDGWSVTDVQIGNRPQMVGPLNIPATEFARPGIEGLVEFDVVQVAMDVRLTVRNEGAGGPDAIAWGLRLDGITRWFSKGPSMILEATAERAIVAVDKNGRRERQRPRKIKPPRVLTFNATGDGTPDACIYAVDDATGLTVLEYDADGVRFNLDGVSREEESRSTTTGEAVWVEPSPSVG